MNPDGHYRGGRIDKASDGADPKDLEAVEEQIGIIAQLDDGSHVLLRPAEFRERFGWKNEPSKARFLGWSR